MKNKIGLCFLSVFLFTLSFSSSVSLAAAKAKKKEEPSAKVWVFKEDGSKSCEGKGDPEQVLQKELEQEGVKVYQSKKESDGKMHIQMCGAPSGKGYAFEIDEKNAIKVEALGYKVKSLTSENKTSEK